MSFRGRSDVIPPMVPVGNESQGRQVAPSAIDAAAVAVNGSTIRLSCPADRPSGVLSHLSDLDPAGFRLLRHEEIHPTWIDPAMDPSLHAPNGRVPSLRYGLLLLDEQGLILVRKPSDRTRGHAWTFAQGGPLAGEAAYDTAIRETLEETGYLGRPLLALPGQFAGRRRVARFFLARPVEYRPEAQDGETEEVRWVKLAEACCLVSFSNRKRRERDLRILEVVVEQVPGLGRSPGS